MEHPMTDMARHGRYDAIIVGGGLAGLSAACELSKLSSGAERRVLLLEADDRPGGKVRTESKNGIAYETGAIFAYDPKWFDFTVDAGAHDDNDHPVALLHRGQLYTGGSVDECASSLCPEMRQWLCLPFFLSSPSPQEAMVGGDLAAAMKAFFCVIHPGTPTEAVPARRRDCLLRHRADRFERGNGAMIDAMAARCGAEIKTGCRVSRLEPARGEQNAKVFWRGEDGAEEEAEAGKIILAVPAT
ncbi:MAG: FAD-dependent oxidoreductase, partial [Synergistaceae bacterium]|nr:FAD-dependent oxidoreductase [Synergistaceae bacterium]